MTITELLSCILLPPPLRFLIRWQQVSTPKTATWESHSASGPNEGETRRERSDIYRCGLLMCQSNQTLKIRGALNILHPRHLNHLCGRWRNAKAGWRQWHQEAVWRTEWLSKDHHLPLPRVTTPVGSCEHCSGGFLEPSQHAHCQHPGRQTAVLMREGSEGQVTAKGQGPERRSPRLQALLGLRVWLTTGS